MYALTATRTTTNNGRRLTGTAAILLTVLEDRTAPVLSRTHAARVLANLGTAGALPALRRLARSSSEAEVRTAAREACQRIAHERKSQQPGRRHRSTGHHAA